MKETEYILLLFLILFLITQKNKLGKTQAWSDEYLVSASAGHFKSLP